MKFSFEDLKYSWTSQNILSFHSPKKKSFGNVFFGKFQHLFNLCWSRQGTTDLCWSCQGTTVLHSQYMVQSVMCENEEPLVKSPFRGGQSNCTFEGWTTCLKLCTWISMVRAKLYLVFVVLDMIHHACCTIISTYGTDMIGIEVT